MKAIVFGANGQLGKSIVDELLLKGFDVATTSRDSKDTEFQTKDGFAQIISSGMKFDACIWAQGQNVNDTLESATNFDSIIDANLIFTVNSLRVLLENNLLDKGARMAQGSG